MKVGMDGCEVDEVLEVMAKHWEELGKKIEELKQRWVM